MTAISLFGSDGFDPSSDNGGQLASDNLYESHAASKRDIANSILNQLGGGKDYGFNLNDIVDALVQGDMRDTIPDLQRQITNTNVRISAIAKLENLMMALKKTTLSPTEQGISPYMLQSSDPAGVIIENNAGSNTDAIQPFSVAVSQLATTCSVLFDAGAGQSSPDAIIAGSGTLSIQLGSSAAVDITIPENSSLTNIADHINAAGAGITASVVKSTDGYRLAVFSNNTGESNEISTSFTGADSNLKSILQTSAVKQPAVNAEYTINGITMSAENNHVTYGGVALFLAKNSTTAIISTSTNTAVVAKSVAQFVQNYNELMGEINQLTASTPGKDYRGALYQDNDLQSVKDSLRNTMLSTLPNGTALYNLGIDYNHDGSLCLNSSVLNSALEANPNLANTILATHVSASNPYVQVMKYSNEATAIMGATQSGTYDVNITQAAAIASLSATNTTAFVDGSITTTEDIVMNITVAGTPNPDAFDAVTGSSQVTVTIPAGTYTKTALANQIQSQVNEASGVGENNAGVSVSFDDDGKLQIASHYTGSRTTFQINSSGSAHLEDLGLVGADIDTLKQGSDVQGTVNGQMCIGVGKYLQVLDGDDDTRASGFVIQYSGTSIGDMGTVTLSEGYSEQLDRVMTGLMKSNELNPNGNGLLAAKLYQYQQDVNPDSLDSLINKLKDAGLKENQLTQMYLNRYQNVNALLSRLSHESQYISAMFSGKDDKE